MLQGIKNKIVTKKEVYYLFNKILNSVRVDSNHLEICSLIVTNLVSIEF